jgi:hypothetical protein
MKLDYNTAGSLYNPYYFRICFYLFFFGSIASTIAFNNDAFYIFYILSVIFLGLGFYKKSVTFVLVVAAIVVVFRFFYYQMGDLR